MENAENDKFSAAFNVRARPLFTYQRAESIQLKLNQTKRNFMK